MLQTSSLYGSVATPHLQTFFAKALCTLDASSCRQVVGSSELLMGLSQWLVMAILLFFVLLLGFCLTRDLLALKENNQASVNHDNQDKLVAESIDSLVGVDLSVLTDHINDIARENAMTTQLDLARAYLEIGNHELAYPILQQVVHSGDDQQRLIAHSLLQRFFKTDD